MSINPIKAINKRITAKLSLALIFFGLLPLIFSGLMYLRVSNHYLEQRILEHLYRSVQLNEDYIVNYLERFMSQTRLMGIFPSIGECARQRMPLDKDECKAIDSFLERTIRVDHRLIEVYMLDPDKAEVFYSTDPAQLGKQKMFRDYFENGRYGPYLTSIYYSFILNDLAITISAPIYTRQGELAAVMASRVAVRAITENLAGFGAIERGERVYMVTRFHFVVSSDHDEQNYPFQEIAHGFPIDDALRGMNGSARYVNYRGVEVYGAWKWIENLRVAIITEREYEKEMKPMGELRRGIIIISLAAAAILILILVFIGHGFTGSIARMVDVAEKLGEGDFSQRLEVRFDDERGAIARSMNAMAEALEAREKEMIETLRALGQAYEEMKSLDKMKTALLSNVSHELRTPLSSIRGYGELMAKGKFGPLTHAQTHGLDVILRNSHRLAKLIENLLEFSGMEAGISKFIPTRFDVCELIKERFDSFIPIADKADIKINLNLPGEEVLIEADHGKLGRMLDNLIDNAIKFTPAEGSISVTLKPRKLNLALIVEDTGVGIPRELKEKIFVRFFQAEYSAARRWGGMGIGLSIVKEVVEMHGGVVKVVSNEGKGTKFTIILPCSPSMKLKRTE